MNQRHPRSFLELPHRREFLSDVGMGFTGLAIGAMLHRDSIAQESSRQALLETHPIAKAKSVIWLFMNGGVSHMETFDPKPFLNTYAGKTISETPYADVQNPKKLANERVTVPDANGNQRNTLFRS